MEGMFSWLAIVHCYLFEEKLIQPLNSTTGGKGGATTTVSTLAQFSAVADNSKNNDVTPLIIVRNLFLHFSLLKKSYPSTSIKMLLLTLLIGCIWNDHRCRTGPHWLQQDHHRSSKFRYVAPPFLENASNSRRSGSTTNKKTKVSSVLDYTSGSRKMSSSVTSSLAAS